MEIIINTDKETITVPQDIFNSCKILVKHNKKMSQFSALSNMFNFSDFKLVAKQSNTKSDKTNAKTITEFMESVKNNDKENYRDFMDMKNSKTNFFKIKKWFYEKYPSQKPF